MQLQGKLVKSTENSQKTLDLNLKIKVEKLSAELENEKINVQVISEENIKLFHFLQTEKSLTKGLKIQIQELKANH